MKTELWIIFAQDSAGHITLAGTYEVEHDPLPGLQHVLATCDPEAMNSTRFFAARIQNGEEVTLHYINHLPIFDVAEAGADGHSNPHCGGCRDGRTNRNEHVCKMRS